MKNRLLRLLLTTLILLGAATASQAETVRVLMKTNMGDIELELYRDKAPKTVANFLRYAEKGFYNDTIFHRVIPYFMIQGGGFTQDLEQKPTLAPVANEAKNGLKNVRGSIAMARLSDPHSATAQFFINHVDNPNLDFPKPDGWGYAVFGKVTKGMDTVDKIADVFVGTRKGMKGVPEQPVLITSVTQIGGAQAQ
jgi:peptidyl-prolyl cis-trans isomerase A (cyclophilin A)